MATCSSILAWQIPWTEEPGGLQSTGNTKESGVTRWLNNSCAWHDPQLDEEQGAESQAVQAEHDRQAVWLLLASHHLLPSSQKWQPPGLTGDRVCAGEGDLWLWGMTLLLPDALSPLSPSPQCSSELGTPIVSGHQLPSHTPVTQQLRVCRGRVAWERQAW